MDSGDDHDYCIVTHPYPSQLSSPQAHKQHLSTEITIKSMSMAMGIKHPGFQLLSLISTEPHQQQLHTLCALPNQLGIFVWGYALLGVISLVGLFVANVYRVRNQAKGRGRERGREKFRSRTPMRTEEAMRLVNVDRPGGGRGATLDVEGGGKRGRRLSASGNEAESLDERTGEGFINGMVNGLGHGRAPVQILPAPLHRHRERAFTWTFIIGNKRRRLSIPCIPFLGCECRKGQTKMRDGRGYGSVWKDQREDEFENGGLGRNFVSDVGSVAWPPVAIFLVIALWMFR